MELAEPGRPCNISVPAGALAAAAGEPTAASNTIRVTWWEDGPQVRRRRCCASCDVTREMPHSVACQRAGSQPLLPCHPHLPACAQMPNACLLLYPQPEVRIAGKYAAADSPRIPLVVDFGRRVQQLNPLGLFNATGFGRWGRRGAGLVVLDSQRCTGACMARVLCAAGSTLPPPQHGCSAGPEMTFWCAGLTSFMRLTGAGCT